MRAYLVLLTLSSIAGAQTSNVIKYHATINDVKYVYGPAAPVAHVKSGDIIETNTLDAFGNVLKKPGDTQSMVKGDNPLTGPFYVDGAQPGDTLAVKILDLQVDGNQGVGAFAPGFRRVERNQLHAHAASAVAGKDLVLSHRQGEQHGDVQRSRLEVFRQDSAASFLRLYRSGAGRRRGAQFDCACGIRRQYGCSRSQRGQYVVSSGERAGRAALYGRWARRDGRWGSGGTAIEVSLLARIQVSVIKGRKINWPRFENNDSIMAVGAYRPLDDALRIAFTELVDWIHKDYGLSSLDAYELLSKVAKIHLDEMVDPNYVVVASIDKKFLPAEKEVTRTGSAQYPSRVLARSSGRSLHRRRGCV